MVQLAMEMLLLLLLLRLLLWRLLLLLRGQVGWDEVATAEEVPAHRCRD